MRSYYLGIDLAGSEERPSAWAALDDAVNVVGMGHVRSDAEIISLAGDMRPVCLAIDAPLSLPRGLSSLDDVSAARGLPTGRSCERALKKLGIGCFYTTPRSIIKGMVYRAIALRQALEGQGYVVLEVFPYASKVRLFGRRDLPKKTRVQGRAWLQAALAHIVPDLARRGQLSHDELDALVAAYTGLLHARGQAEALGDEDEGLLWVPTSSQYDSSQ